MTNNTFTIISSLCLGLIILLILYFIWSRYVRTEEFISAIDGRDYRIISTFNKETHAQAADRLALINIFALDLINRLQKKYINGPDEFKANIVKNLTKRYNPNILQENNPISIKNTSYVVNKGEEIAFCLREKESGRHKFHDINDIKYVVLHELAHLALDVYGHPRIFWQIFSFLQHEAKELGKYTPINYALPGNALSYCGVNIRYNPYFAPNIQL